MGSKYLWAGPIGLLASLLVITLLAPVSRNSKRVELVEKKGLLSISRQKQLVARGRAMEMRRLTLLAAAAGEAEAEGPCVSWRGCQHESFYNNQTMNTSKAFYDRFDSFPNAWDSSPAARWFRHTYPENTWPSYTGEETVIVGGDPAALYPNSDYGAPYGRSLQPYEMPTYYY